MLEKEAVPNECAASDVRAAQDARDAGAPEVTVGEGQRLGAESLDAFFARAPQFALAFSGGADSAYLLAAALRAGCTVGVYCVKTAFQADFELDDARMVLRALGRDAAADDAVRGMRVLRLDVLSQPDVCANSPDRCYLCKRFILGAVREAAARDGFDVLADGTNATDDPARRPGFRALAELGAVSPLRRAGMTKEDVRAASRALGVPTADKPSFSCLATAVAQGERLTEASLAQAARERGVDGGRRPWNVPEPLASSAGNGKAAAASGAGKEDDDGRA